MTGSSCTIAEEDYSNNDTSSCTPCHHTCLPDYQPETISQAVMPGNVIYPVIRDTSFHLHTIGGFNCFVLFGYCGWVEFTVLAGFLYMGIYLAGIFLLAFFSSSVQVLLIFRNAGFKFRGFKYFFDISLTIKLVSSLLNFGNTITCVYL